MPGTDELLLRETHRFGLEISLGQVALFERYLALLQEWQGRMNLSAIRDRDGIVVQHFVDSLMVLRELPAEGIASVVDVGSGAGFPGAVLALMRPNWRVTLVERIQKKAAFLQVLRRELGLSLVTVCAKDAGTLGEQFDLAVSRAALPPQEWVGVGSRLVKDRGRLVVMMGRREEVPGPLGFELERDCSYDLGQSQHRIQVFRRGGVDRNGEEHVPRGTFHSDLLRNPKGK